MKTKYVCRGLNSRYVNFHNNRTMWLTNLHAKICRWGGGQGKRAQAGCNVPIAQLTSNQAVHMQNQKSRLINRNQMTSKKKINKKLN